MRAPISEEVKAILRIHIYHPHPSAVLPATGTVIYPARQELQHALHTMQVGAMHWGYGPPWNVQTDAATQVSQGIDVVCE